MNKSDRRANYNLKHVFVDFIIVVFTYTLVFFLTPAYQAAEHRLWYIVLLAFFYLVFYLIMMLLRMYNLSTFFYYDRVTKNTSIAWVGATVTVFLSLFLSYNTMFSRLFLGFFALCGLMLLIAGKMIIILRKKGRSQSKQNIIYVGEKSMLANFMRYADNSSYGFNTLGYIDTNGDGADLGGPDRLPRLGSIDELESILRECSCDNVIFTQALSGSTRIEPYLQICSQLGVVARVLLDVHDIKESRCYVSSLGTYPMLTYYNVTLDPVALMIKRVIDIIGSAVGIVLTSPIMLATALAIKLDSHGPVFFKQVRVGHHGRKFYIYKFRSMHTDAEARKQELMRFNEMGDNRLFKMKDDPRVTRVGRFIRKMSIDELPQFFNVFLGNMSLVGTRPPTVNEVEQYDTQHLRRVSIKPGITGAWQTSGRNTITDFDEIVKLEIEYIEKWSIALDFRLLFRTVGALLDRDGAY